MKIEGKTSEKIMEKEKKHRSHFNTKKQKRKNQTKAMETQRERKNV
jgi:hypothetical protein